MTHARGVSSTPSHCASSSASKSTQRQLTIMLVTICCAAVCLQLPYTIVYLINDEKQSLWPGDRTLHAKVYLFTKVTDVIATSNYAVNFALYCVSGSKFRQGAKKMCQGCGGIQRHRNEHHQPAKSFSMGETTRGLLNANKLTSIMHSHKCNAV